MVKGAWRELTDVKSGKKYYYNKKTKETTWKKPRGFVGTRDSSSRGGEGSSSDEFWARTDPKSGKTYYIDSKTRETTWTLPRGARVVEKPKKKKKKKKTSPYGSSKRLSPSSSSSSPSTVHIGRNGSIDISRMKSSPTSSDTSTMSTEDILKKYRSLGGITERATRSPEKVHVGRTGSVDITGIGENVSIEESSTSFKRDNQTREKTSSSRAELQKSPTKVHVGRTGSIDITRLGIDATGDEKVSSAQEGDATPSTTSNTFSPSRIAFDNGDPRQAEMHASPYNSILMETRMMSKETVELEQQCEDLDSELSNFRVGVKSTLGKVQDLLNDLTMIEKRSTPEKEKKPSTVRYLTNSSSSSRRSPQSSSSRRASPSSALKSSPSRVHISRRGSISISQ